MNSAGQGVPGDPYGCKPDTFECPYPIIPKKETVALKLCPFCHGEVELRSKMDGRDETYFIHCTKCHMWFEKFDYRAMDEKKIIIEWNRRAEE